MVILLTLFFLSFSFFFFPLKRKRNGLVCLSVLAWLLCPCGLSVWLCSLVFFCLAVFRCFCSVCVWAAGCVAARLCCCCTVVWGPCCVSFLLCPVFVDFGGWSHFRVPLVHVMSCWVAHAYPALVFVGWVCVWTFSKEVKLVGFFGSRGARPPVMTLPNKASHWRGSRVWSTLCTCVLVEIDYNMVNFVKTLVTRVSFLGFLFQAVGAYSLKMELTSLSWTWHRTCYQSYISVCVCVCVKSRLAKNSQNQPFYGACYFDHLWSVPASKFKHSLPSEPHGWPSYSSSKMSLA